MGSLLSAQGKKAEAEPFYREGLESCRRIQGNDHPSTLISMNNMASLLRDLGRHAEAEEVGAEAIQCAQRVLPVGHWHNAVIPFQHGRTLAAMERFAEAEAEMLQAHQMLVDALGPNHPHVRKGFEFLIAFYEAWHAAEPAAGYDATAAEWREKLEGD